MIKLFFILINCGSVVSEVDSIVVSDRLRSASEDQSTRELPVDLGRFPTVATGRLRSASED